MEVSYMKGLASHHGPESCLDRQQWDGEALTGESTGALTSSENTSNRRRPYTTEGKAISSIPKRRGLGDCGGVKERQHVWKFTTRESGDPASPLVNGKRQKGSVNEGENPKN